MPTRQQIDAVIERLERLVGGQFEPLGATALPASDADGLVPWQGLSRPQQESVLTLDADWEGFTAAQEADAIRRVLDGEEADFWMDGVAAEDEPRLVEKQLTSSGMFHTPGFFRALQNDYRIPGEPGRRAVQMLSGGYGMPREEAEGLLSGTIKIAIDEAAGTITYTVADAGGPPASGPADKPPSNSITAAILDNPKAFLPEQREHGEDHGHGHDGGPDRGR